MIRASPLLATYGAPVDREWAYELLRGKPASTQPVPGATHAPPAGRGGIDANDWGNHGGGQAQRRPAPQLRESAPTPHQESGGGLFGGLGEILTGSTGPRGGHRQGMIEAAAKSAARGMANSVGLGIDNQILRGMLGLILGSAETGAASRHNRSLSSTTRVNVNLSLASPLQARLHGWWVSIYPDATELPGPFLSVADQIAVAGRRAARLSLRLS